MQNYKQPGEQLRFTAAADLGAGVGVIVGNLFMVTVSAVKSGAEVVGRIVGVYELPKATGQVWAMGAKVYWDDTAKNVTTTVGSNRLIGAAARPAVSGATLGEVRLNGQAF